ncbi:hypothetical protein [Hydrogenimonas thermophila]|uniref:MetA-pathway of phenol degradation n=1 Tax=Hydrogenimonas thermophila TaxID=223786 RepID=A0A1I5TA80_9BACT|nr:hypothetical protein [Hydrogenimonas thermophila]SFP79954.1 hypothetical protein SAMN05216234_1421 [Hydrogenimonas thermophila]
MNITKTLVSLATASALSCSFANAGSSITAVSIGGTYSEGKYGTDSSTQVYYVPVVASYQKEMFSASVTIPYIKIDSKGSFTWTPSGPVPVSPSKPADIQNLITNFDPFNPSSSTTTSERTVTDGLGDIIVNAAYTFVPAQGLYLKTSLLMKVATADDKKGLGTGENDYSFQADIYKPIGKSFLYVTGGYTVTGDSDKVKYNDIWYGTVGTGYRFNQQLSFGANYAYRQAMFDSLEDTKTTSIFLSYNAKNGLKYDVSYTYGLSDTAADNAVTLNITKRF